MATQTIDLGSFAGSLVRFEGDYNDANGRVTTLRCINNGTSAAWGAAITNSGEIFSTRFPIGMTNITIPAGKINVKVVNGEVAFDGGTSFVYPYP